MSRPPAGVGWATVPTMGQKILLGYWHTAAIDELMMPSRMLRIPADDATVSAPLRTALATDPNGAQCAEGVRRQRGRLAAGASCSVARGRNAQPRQVHAPGMSPMFASPVRSKSIVGTRLKYTCGQRRQASSRCVRGGCRMHGSLRRGGAHRLLLLLQRPTVRHGPRLDGLHELPRREDRAHDDCEPPVDPQRLDAK